MITQFWLARPSTMFGVDHVFPFGRIRWARATRIVRSSEGRTRLQQSSFVANANISIRNTAAVYRHSPRYLVTLSPSLVYFGCLLQASVSGMEASRIEFSPASGTRTLTRGKSGLISAANQR